MQLRKRCESHLLAFDIDTLHFCGDHTDERDILVDKDTLTSEVFTEPPHLVAAQVLIGKREFDIVSRMTILVYLTCM